MIRALVFIFVFAVATTSYGSCEALHEYGLNQNQISLLKKSYDYGKQFDWGLTLAAIAWKESSAGKYLINLQDPSVGPFHVTIDKVLRHLNLPDTPFNQNRAAQIGIERFDVTAFIAVMELAYWKVERGRTWRETLVSYNAGNNLKSERGQAYAEDVAQKVGVLKQCGWQ